MSLFYSAGLGGSAIPDTEVDQFEWGGPVTDRYSGDTGNFAINSTPPVFEGSFSLKAVNTINESMISYPGDGLPNYPSRGDWIRGIVRPESSASRVDVLVFAESGSGWNNVDGYRISADVNSGIFSITDDQNSNTFDSGGTPTAGQSYLVDIYSDSSEIQVDFTDRSDDSVAASLSATDSDYSGSGFGFGHRSDETYDDFRMLAAYGLP